MVEACHLRYRSLCKELMGCGSFLAACGTAKRKAEQSAVPTTQRRRPEPPMIVFLKNHRRGKLEPVLIIDDL